MSDSNENDAAPVPAEASAAPPSEAPATDDGAGLEALTAERDRIKSQLLRTAADFENFRKRSRRDVDDARRRAQEDVLRAVVPLIDNLERAVDAAASAATAEQVADGVRMVLRGFEDVASQLGLQRVDPKGAPFDPNVHDAIQQMETTDHAPGTVVSVVVPGYFLGDKLLRPSMVVVARAPAGAPPPGGDEPGGTLDA